MRVAIALWLTGALLCLPAFGLAFSFPPLTGWVVDQAGIMTAQSRSQLETKLKNLEDKSGIQVVVATVKSLEGSDIETYANQLFRNWRLGEAKKNNGVLLLVAPNEHKVRIEVGYGLEGTLTDALSSVIISSAMVPRFKANDFSGGIERGVDGIITVLSGDTADWQPKPSVRAEDPPQLSNELFSVLADLAAASLAVAVGPVAKRRLRKAAASQVLRSFYIMARRRPRRCNRTLRRSTCTLWLTGALLCLPAFGLAFSFPPLTGWVVDQAGIMTAQSRSQLETKLKNLEDKSGIQVVVATVKSLEGSDIETYANQLFRNWRLGEAKKNNGVLLLVAPNEHKVRIEVQLYFLRPALSAAMHCSMRVAIAQLPYRVPAVDSAQRSVHGHKRRRAQDP